MQKVLTPREKGAVANARQDERTGSSWRHIAHVDQTELDCDLRYAKALYEFHIEHKSGKAWRDHRDAVKSLRKGARLLKKSLAAGSVRRTLPLNLRALDDKFLDDLISWAKNELVPKELSQLDREMEPYVRDAVGLGRVSAVEFMVGEHLPRIFTKHLRQRVATALDGPYVGFALDVLAEWGVTGRNGLPLSPESVVRALMLAQGSGTRRMGKAD